MPFIPVSNTIRISLQFLIAGQVVVNTIHLNRPTTIDESAMSDASTAAVNWWETYVRTVQSSDLSLQLVNVLNLTSDSSPSISVPISGTPSGNVVQPACPNNVAAVISWRTASRGRSFRGRFYVPGIPRTSVQDPGTMTSTLQTALTVAALNLASFFASLSLTPVVVSRFHNGLPRVGGIVTPIISAIVDNKFDSQRRRLAGRGI